jgi:hypothetical protein|tara:strand:+ start:356 stop:700 length:345 start_codon:yes stop_codon:yes gene_type:complete
MSDFFQSEMVRGDIQEMMELQRYCFQAAHAFPVLSHEKKLEYFNILEELIEKQKIFNARMSLSDDPEATEMVESMKIAAVMLGGDANKSINEIFDDLLSKVASMRDRLESGIEE